MDRRSFLRKAGAGILGTSLASTTASATSSSEWEHYAVQPDYVTLSFDAERLSRFQPSLVTRHLDVKPSAVHGLVATDTRADGQRSDMLVYFAEYPFQRGISPFPGVLSDSHYGDHEPFYVEVDPDTGTVLQVHYSAYHWLRASVVNPPTVGRTHPTARVIEPWHQHSLTTNEGSFPQLRDLTKSYPDWLSNGLASAIEPGVVTDPWRMRQRASWWRSAEAAGVEVSTSELLWQLLAAIGYGTADKSDI